MLRNIAVGLMMLMTGLGGMARGAAPEEAAGDAALAERLASISADTLRGQSAGAASVRAAAALLEGARKLNPSEPRYPRLLTEAYLQLKDYPSAKESLKAYRELEPNDRVAQVKLIDLYVTMIETADAQVDYLQQVAQIKDLPETVKAHVLVAMARAYLKRAQDKQADDALKQALALNPLDMDALRLKWDRLPNDAPSADRVALLVQILRSNPAQPSALASLADELADAGLPEMSLDWYNQAFGVTRAKGQTSSPQLLQRVVVELYLSGKPDQAQALAKSILNGSPEQGIAADPDSTDALLVLALVQKSGEKATYDQGRQQAVNALWNRLVAVRNELGASAATTRPITATTQELPDLSPDVDRLKKADPALRDAYVSAASDLAWFELYFNEDAKAADKLIDPLSKALPEGNLTVARLQGWSYLVGKKADEAKVKLSAVADRDPLSKLGMIRLQMQAGEDKAKLAEQARQLLGENPSQSLGAVLWDALRDLVGTWPEPARAAAAREAVGKLPNDWLTILDPKQAGKFYSLRFEPKQVGHAYGEPLWAQVTVQNVSNYDLTAGNDGVIHPDLWVEASLRGLGQQSLGPVAFEQLGGLLVLKKGQSVSRMVRVDQMKLATILQGNPQMTLQISADVTTNPVTLAAGAVPGPAGQRSTLDRLFLRSGYALSPDGRRRLMETVRTGAAGERLRFLELLAVFNAQIARNPQGPDAQAAQAFATDASEALRKAATDANASVSAWAQFLQTQLAAPADAGRLATAMCQDEHWTSRLLGLVAIQRLSPDEQKRLAGQVEKREDTPLVNTYAQALAEIAAALPATTQATQPTTQPNLAAPLGLTPTTLPATQP